MKGEAALSLQLESVIQKSKPIFAAGLDLNAATLNMLENNGVVVVDPMSSGLWVSVTVDPGQLKLMNGEDFASVYRQAYGRDPDLRAIHGYLAARIIAAVVRGSNDQIRASPAKLKQALDEVLDKSRF
jgi:hypothetical protein